MDILRFWAVVTPSEMDNAKEKPIRFFLFEFMRHAAILSLVLLVSELALPLADTFHSPLRRAIFVGWWAAVMSGWRLWSGRRTAQGAI